MKFVVFGAHKRVGLWHGDEIRDVAGLTAKYLREKQNEKQPLPMADALTPPDLEAFIEGGDRALDTVRKAQEYLFGGAASKAGVDGEKITFDARTMNLYAPKPRRGRVAFCGGNFPAHSAGMAVNRGDAAASRPRTGIRCTTTPSSASSTTPRSRCGSRRSWGSCLPA